MKKYWEFFKVETAIYFNYRLSFIIWRIRNVLTFILLYYLWTAVFESNARIFSYSQEHMITYVLLIGLANSLVLSSRTADVSSEIVSGAIINYLTKPISFLGSVITREFVDKFYNAFFAVFEFGLFIMLLKPLFFIQTDVSVYPFFIIAVIMGIILTFFISFTLSLMAFWTAETWAPRFIYFVLISILAGTAFPLDILPPTVYNTLLLTPFPYLVFLPLKIYLNGITPQTLSLLVYGSIWTLIAYAIMRGVWHKGMKEFSFYGR